MWVTQCSVLFNPMSASASIAGLAIRNDAGVRSPVALGRRCAALMSQEVRRVQAVSSAAANSRIRSAGRYGFVRYAAHPNSELRVDRAEASWADVTITGTRL